MKSLHRFAVGAILAVAVLFPPLVSAQAFLKGNLIEFGRDVYVSHGAIAQADRPLLRFAAGTPITPGPSLMEIATDGSIEFFNFATIDFASFAPDSIAATWVGGWIAVRVAGEYVLIPGYRFVATPAAPPAR